MTIKKKSELQPSALISPSEFNNETLHLPLKCPVPLLSKSSVAVGGLTAFIIILPFPLVGSNLELPIIPWGLLTFNLFFNKLSVSV